MINLVNRKYGIQALLGIHIENYFYFSISFASYNSNGTSITAKERNLGKKTFVFSS